MDRGTILLCLAKMIDNTHHQNKMAIQDLQRNFLALENAKGHFAAPNIREAQKDKASHPLWMFPPFVRFSRGGELGLSVC